MGYIQAEPLNEGKDHFRTKQKLINLLRSVNTLDVVVPCSSSWSASSKPYPYMISGSLTSDRGRGGGMFWRCRNEHVVLGWAKGWERVESEVNIPGVGRLDIGLIFPNSNYEEYEDQHALTAEAEKKRIRDERKLHHVFLANPYYREWYSSLCKWKETAVDSVLTYPGSLSIEDRRVIHLMAEVLQLGHSSEDFPSQFSEKGIQRITVFKQPASEPRPHQNELKGLVAVEVFSTSEVTPLKKKRLSKANIPWIELSTLPHNLAPKIPIRVMSIAGHPTAKREENVPGQRNRDDAKKVPHEWRWVCPDCTEKIQDRLVFSRVGAVVDWYMKPSTPRALRGKQTRRVFSILEDNSRSGFFLTEGGFDVLGGRHDMFEHENHLLARASSLEALHDAYTQRLQTINRQVGSSAQAMVERVEWPGVEPSGLFDQHDQKIMGVVPTFATPSLLLPSLDRKLRPVMQWDIQKRMWQTQGHSMNDEDRKSVV